MLKTSKVHTCVLFDPRDGKIRHIHKEFTLEGAQIPSESQIEARVREHVARRGRDTHELRIAFVDDTRFQNKHYRLDPQSLKFVEVDRASLKS